METMRLPLGRSPQAAVEETLAGLEPLPRTPRAVRLWAAAGFPLATLLVLLLGVLLVYLFFVRPDAFSEWFAFKPGILVDMAAESGKLQVQPFQETLETPLHWYKEAINFHSFRWAATLLFLGLRDVTGLEMRELSIAPFGILIFLLALLFVFLSADTGPAGRWGFLLSALLVLFNWPMMGWVFHSGAWPAATMVLLSVGMLLQAYGRHRHQVWFRGMALLFMLLAFGYYHATAVLLTFLLPILFVYQVVVSFTSRWRSKRAFAPAFSYSNLAAITVAWFFIDPLTNFVLASGITRPWQGVESFYTSIFERGGDLVPFEVGYTPVGRIVLMLPLVTISLAGGWLWLRTQLATLLMGRPLSEQQVISGAMYIAAPVMLLAGVMSGTGGFRFPESYFLMIIGVPLLLVQHIFRAGSVAGGRLIEGALLAAVLLIVTVSSFVMLSREPISGWVHLQGSDTSAAEFAAENIDVPYYSDNFLTGLILFSNREANVVPVGGLGGDVGIVGEAFYSGPEEFGAELRRRGAEMAVLGARNIDMSSRAGHFATIKTEEFFIDPLPNYDFTSPSFELVYDNGQSRIFRLLPSDDALPQVR